MDQVQCRMHSQVRGRRRRCSAMRRSRRKQSGAHHRKCTELVRVVVRHLCGRCLRRRRHFSIVLCAPALSPNPSLGARVVGEASGVGPLLQGSWALARKAELAGKMSQDDFVTPMTADLTNFWTPEGNDLLYQVVQSANNDGDWCVCTVASVAAAFTYCIAFSLRPRRAVGTSTRS